MTAPRKPRERTRAELVAAALHPQPGALKDGTLALRAELFAVGTSRLPGKSMVYGAQKKDRA